MSVISILISRIQVSEDIGEVIGLVNGLSDIIFLDGLTNEEKCQISTLFISLSEKFPELEKLLESVLQNSYSVQPNLSSEMCK